MMKPMNRNIRFFRVWWSATGTAIGILALTATIGLTLAATIAAWAALVR